MVATIECIDRSRARDSWAISAPSPTIGRSVSTESSRSSSSTPTTRAPLQRSTRRRTTCVRLGRGGLVEHRGRRRPPVDQQRVAVLVAQADPADVARLAGRAPRAGPAGRTPVPRGRRPAARSARGLEDHGVPLDQPALVAEPTAAVSLARQPLRGGGRTLQLDGRPGPRTPARGRSPAATSSSLKVAESLRRHPRTVAAPTRRQAIKPNPARPAGSASSADRNAVIASRASSEANSVALSAARSSPCSSMRATRSRLRIRFDSRRPWAAPVASDAQSVATSASSSLGRDGRP